MKKRKEKKKNEKEERKGDKEHTNMKMGNINQISKGVLQRSTGNGGNAYILG